MISQACTLFDTKINCCAIFKANLTPIEKRKLYNSRKERMEGVDENSLLTIAFMLAANGVDECCLNYKLNVRKMRQLSEVVLTRMHNVDLKKKFDNTCMCIKPHATKAHQHKSSSLFDCM